MEPTNLDIINAMTEQILSLFNKPKMQTSSLFITYDSRIMRYSGIFRCIFSGHPMMWLVYNRRFYFIKFDRPMSIVLCGPQQSGKTSFAAHLQHKLRCFGLSVDVHDECSRESLLRKIIMQEIDDSERQTMEQARVDLIVYCTQDIIHSYAGDRREVKVFNLENKPS